MSGSDSTATQPRSAEILEGQNRWIFPCVKPLYAEPVVMESGSGVWVKDVDGGEYLDLFAGILSTPLGHCHPRVTAAVGEQIQKLGHTSTLYVTEPQVHAARKMAEIAPGGLDRTFFLNSGTEAIETALQMAQLYTGRSEIVGLRMSYHGRSAAASNVTANASWRPLATSIAGFKHALAPYRYRSHIDTQDEAELAEFYANDLDETIRTTTNGRPAAFIAEAILGVAGYVVPPKGYFKRCAEIIRSYGGVLIVDEVQAGFGRTGKHWFEIMHSEVEPDIMVTAKGIANGYPAAATMTRTDIAEKWRGNTISTFGGNPVSMAACSATLDVMREEDVRTRSTERGEQLRGSLENLKDQFEWIGDVRGRGLMRGMELVRDRNTKEPAPDLAKALLEAAKGEGLLIGVGGHWGQVIRIGPSMLITQEELAEGMKRLQRACEKVAQHVAD